MKRVYLKPFCEDVRVNLKGSVLQGNYEGGSKGAWGSGWGKENNMGWDDEVEDDKPRNINLWEE